MEKIVFNTNGSGYWSTVAKAVTITNMQCRYDEDYKDFGELVVCFDDSWICEEDGLIYTDKRFISDLRSFLDAHGLPGNDVDYSEQGMQEYDYVSLDCGARFIKAWEAKFGIPTV